MGATSAVVQGLSGEELQTIRDAVAAGRKPKVMFTESAGQIAGRVGQVVELTDPARSDEWMVVRFGKDELPFSPIDLTLPPRRSSRRPDSRTAPGEAAGPELKITREAPPRSNGASRNNEPSCGSEPRGGDRASTATVDAAGTGPGAKPARRSGRAARSKGAAGLTVTLTFQEGQWSVSATRGNRSLTRPHVVKPAEALRMVAFVDVPEVHEVVDQILAAERAEAERQAEQLRVELAEVEARLAELKQTG